jgi:hypothetical protein
VVGHLPSMCKVLCSISSTEKQVSRHFCLSKIYLNQTLGPGSAHHWLWDDSCLLTSKFAVTAYLDEIVFTENTAKLSKLKIIQYFTIIDISSALHWCFITKCLMLLVKVKKTKTIEKSKKLRSISSEKNVLL